MLANLVREQPSGMHCVQFPKVHCVISKLYCNQNFFTIFSVKTTLTAWLKLFDYCIALEKAIYRTGCHIMNKVGTVDCGGESVLKRRLGKK